jgi:type IV secretory pathway VirB10-like protein
MNHTGLTSPLRLLLAGALLAVSAQALAQFIWIDDKGVKQLSDRPPPPSVPANRILKAPGKPIVTFNPNAPAEPVADAPPEAAEPKAKAAPTLADRNAEFKKRQTEAAEAAKKASDEAARKAEQASNCEAARNNQRSLDQGVRMSGFDKNGERTILNDSERAEMARKSQQILSSCK